MNSKSSVSSILLNWYDRNARILPWRIPPSKTINGLNPDPYHVWVSEIMLQQTTVKSVIPYFKMFITRWPNISKLSKATDEEILNAWAGLGYYNRARKLIECARLISKEFNGVFPENEKHLLSLPGIGPYTSAALRSIAFGKKAVVVDGNIERVISRFNSIQTPLPSSKNLIYKIAESFTPFERPGDYAQAIMDLGAMICKPKSPKCYNCPLKNKCRGYNDGTATSLPKKPKKKKLPTRYGFTFLAITKDNCFLTVKRPNSGLLGGTTCLPSSDWKEKNESVFVEPFPSNWVILDTIVEHTFTHFKLKLKLVKGLVENVPEGYKKREIKTFNVNTLPTVMKKAFLSSLNP